ncbi:hypothetical protein LKL48_16540, partial [Listeria monocytogenes]|nr:hypothetical protein [Listeria monocytogenes]
MTKGIKIATIGGGSSYTPELIEGFIKRQDELPAVPYTHLRAQETRHELVGRLLLEKKKTNSLVSPPPYFYQLHVL